MSKISGISHISSLLKQQANKGEQVKKRERLAQGKSAEPQAGIEPVEKATLADLVQQSCKEIDAQLSDEEKTRQLVRAILAWQFGDDLLDDPNFYKLVDKVCAAIAASETLQQEFQDLFSNKASK